MGSRGTFWVILWLEYHYGTVMLVILEAPTVETYFVWVTRAPP